jgi:hypothetical protein
MNSLEAESMKRKLLDTYSKISSSTYVFKEPFIFAKTRFLQTFGRIMTMQPELQVIVAPSFGAQTHPVVKVRFDALKVQQIVDL